MGVDKNVWSFNHFGVKKLKMNEVALFEKKGIFLSTDFALWGAFKIDLFFKMA